MKTSDTVVQDPSHATVGCVEHGNCVILVTVGPRRQLLDRRRIALTQGLPTHPYHHEGAWAIGRYLDSPWARKITLAEALSVIETVTTAAQEGARRALSELALGVSVPIRAIAIRRCPPVPDAVEERIRDHRAQLIADSILYRRAIASAALELGWSVCWYDRQTVAHEASSALAGADLSAHLVHMGRSAGPPWQAEQKLAATAAMACHG